MQIKDQRTGTWRLSLEQIEATVAGHLGHGAWKGTVPALVSAGRFPCTWGNTSDREACKV